MLHNSRCCCLKQGYSHQLADELCLCCDCQIQTTVDAVIDDTDYGSKGIIMQLDGMSELMG